MAPRPPNNPVGPIRQDNEKEEIPMEDAPEEKKIAVQQTDSTTEEKKEPMEVGKRSNGKKNDVPNKGNAKKANKDNKGFHEPPRPL